MTVQKRILLIDYEPRVTALVRGALEATGRYLIRERHDSRLAVHAVRFFRPDLILCDVLLSRPEGSAMARELQADLSCRDTPVFFLAVNALSPDGSMIFGGFLRGYSVSADRVCLNEFVRCVAAVL